MQVINAKFVEDIKLEFFKNKGGNKQ